MQKILFVCTGNTCRSPMAEALFRDKMADERLQIKSAGVAAYGGQPASPNAVKALSERGITHNHLAQRLDAELVDWADLILTMTFSHKELIHTFFPQSNGKTYTLNEYVGSSKLDIDDPFGGGLSTYQKSRDEIDAALEKLKEKLNRHMQ